MLYHLLTTFSRDVGLFRVFHYPSFRIPAAALTALVLSLWLFPRFIVWLRYWQHGSDNIRMDTPQNHQKKQGTPTMGGIFVVLVIAGCTLLWTDLSNISVWIVLSVLLGFAAIGFIDDMRKITQKNSKGMKGSHKIFWQTMVLVVVFAGLKSLQYRGWQHLPILADTRLALPLISVQWFWPELGFWYLPFIGLLIIGTSHAVNLTDGLDGLAIGPVIVSSSTFLVLAYAAGLVLTFNNHGVWVDFNVADYLRIPHIDGCSELAVICAIIASAGVGFLWFNTHPASVFMGDVGSLSLGGVLGTLAVLTKNEILSALLHGVFLAEALSVMMQVFSFKMWHRRIFRMAPLHHHFELKGLPEPKIIVRFWIIAIILALLSLLSLKLR